MKIKIASKYNNGDNLIFLVESTNQLPKDLFSKDELAFIEKRKSEKKDFITLSRLSHCHIIQFIKQDKTDNATKEYLRKNAFSICKFVNDFKLSKLSVISLIENKQFSIAFVEALILSNYQFLKYFKNRKEKQNSFKEFSVIAKNLKKMDLEELSNIAEANLICRTLVNEPLSYLTASKLSEEIKNLFKDTDAKIEIFNKKKIESLKMGGLLAVNKGSIDPPTFNIIEWKPDNAKNKKPFVLVGKGVVYDTGGLNIKIEENMNDMKCDMAGAAAVIGAMYATVKNQLPIHIIGLIPATDNRPDGNAYVSGDVITMYDGTTVEVINTDAEGRLILADALAYAKKYKPELVIDLATLTGAAYRAIGYQGSVGMGVKSDAYMETLKNCGDSVHERIAEFPFWEEYEKELKSTIADIKNLGSPLAGAITAGKFLAYFTDYPYIHLDIAGPSFLVKKDSYRGIGGTGVGVRLIYDFLKQNL